MTQGADPRVDHPQPVGDIRPVVGDVGAPIPLAYLIGGMAILGLLLFSALNAHRQASAPAVKPALDDVTNTPPQNPELFIPYTAPLRSPSTSPLPPPKIAAQAKPPLFVLPRSKRAAAYRSGLPVSQPDSPPPDRSSPPQPRQSEGQPDFLIYDRDLPPNDRVGVNRPNQTPDAVTRDSLTGTITPTAHATQITNKATTVTQGTLISAVLETALDSTRAGPTRALVTHDVRGYDGSQILVPRGSQLIGEYRADLTAGQKRAFVLWTRLIRPDGVSIALASPAADALGRVGISGRVNTHFFERFSIAFLQSTLQAGVNLASSGSNTAVIIAGSGAGQSVTSALGGNTQYQPTLKVKQGAIISVFVARDLDFSSVDAAR